MEFTEWSTFGNLIFEDEHGALLGLREGESEECYFLSFTNTVIVWCSLNDRSAHLSDYGAEHSWLYSIGAACFIRWERTDLGAIENSSIEWYSKHEMMLSEWQESIAFYSQVDAIAHIRISHDKSLLKSNGCVSPEMLSMTQFQQQTEGKGNEPIRLVELIAFLGQASLNQRWINVNIIENIGRKCFADLCVSFARALHHCWLWFRSYPIFVPFSCSSATKSELNSHHNGWIEWSHFTLETDPILESILIITRTSNEL